MCGGREVLLLLSKQSVNNCEKPSHCHFYCGLLNHFGMSLSCEAVGQEDLPGGIMTGSLGMSPASPFFVTSSDAIPGCVTVYLCAVHNRVSYKECVIKRLQDVLPLML